MCVTCACAQAESIKLIARSTAEAHKIVAAAEAEAVAVLQPQAEAVAVASREAPVLELIPEAVLLPVPVFHNPPQPALHAHLTSCKRA